MVLKLRQSLIAAGVVSCFLLTHAHAQNIPRATVDQISSTHPRIWITQHDLKDLDNRARGSQHSDVQALREDGRGLARAFLYLINGSSSDASAARSYALHTLRHQVTGSGPSDERDVGKNVRNLALIYDWIYSYLSSDDRRRIRAAIMEGINWLDCRYADGESHRCGSRGDGPFHAYISDVDTASSHQTELTGFMLTALLAVVGDFGSGESSLNHMAREYTQTMLDDFRNQWWLMLERTMSDHGGWWMGLTYNGTNLLPQYEAVAALSSASGQNWFQYLPFLGNHAIFMLYTMTDSEKGVNMMFEDMNFPYYRHKHYRLILLISHFYQNAHARWLLDKMDGPWRDTYDWSDAYSYIAKLLWQHSLPEAKSPEELPLNASFESVGYFVTREGWEPDDLVMIWKSAPHYLRTHNNRNNGHFSIFFRGGHLAVDSGRYDKSDSSHHVNYSSKAVAHNTILIGNKHDSSSSRRGNPFEPVNNPYSVHPFQTDYTQNTYAATAKYVYLKADITNTYRKETFPERNRPDRTNICSHCQRTFVYLRNIANWPNPVLITYDDLLGTSTFDKAWLLHSERRPSVDNDVFTHSDKDGKLWAKVLLKDSKDIDVVGGSGQEFTDWGGKNWPMTKEISWPFIFSEDGPARLGRWRIEVSPDSPSRRDHFLTVLAPVERGSDASPDVDEIETSELVGAIINDQVAIFPKDSRNLLRDITYSIPADTYSSHFHLISQAEPYGMYDVNGQIFTATAEGVLTFKIANQSNYQVRFTGSKNTGRLSENWYHPYSASLVDSDVLPVLEEPPYIIQDEGDNTGSTEFANFRFDAESGRITVPMEIETDSAAQGGQFVWGPPESGYGGPGEVSYSFSVAEHQVGEFYVWARVLVPNSRDNSFYVWMDSGVPESAANAWHISPSTEWFWRRVKLPADSEASSFYLEQGTHKLVFHHREDGAALDTVVVTNDPDFDPLLSAQQEDSSGPLIDEDGGSSSGLTSLYFEAESGKITAPMEIDTDSAAQGNQFIWGPPDSGYGGPGEASYSFSVAEHQVGEFYVWARVLVPNSRDNSFYVWMDSGVPESAVNAWHISPSTEWSWRRLKLPADSEASSFHLEQGTHQLVFHNREDGAALDALVITNDPDFQPAND